MATTLTHDDFSARVQRAYSSLLTQARRACGQDGEDVLGECLYHATRAYPSFEQPEGDNGGSFVNWIHRILQNAINDYYRAHNRRQGAEVSLSEVSDVTLCGWEARWAAIECETERSVINDAELIAEARLRMRFADLSEEEGICLSARLEGQKLRTISQSLGLSKPTICRRIQSAVVKIRSVSVTAGMSIGEAPDLDKYQWRSQNITSIYHAPPTVGSMLARERLNSMRPHRLG